MNKIHGKEHTTNKVHTIIVAYTTNWQNEYSTANKLGNGWYCVMDSTDNVHTSRSVFRTADECTMLNTHIKALATRC